MPGDGLTITGGTVLAPARSVAADVVIAGDRVVSVAGAPLPGLGATLDAAGLVVAPGLIDLQCNGAGGIDLATEPERLWEIAVLLPRWGVTAWLPTIVSGPAEVRRRALGALRAGPPDGIARGRYAVPLGLHLEGPFLAPPHRGAHRREHLADPDPAVVAGEDWSAAAGVALVTLAPELPGAVDVVRDLVERGVVVSAGHSGATAGEATAAADAGVTYVTHLFNAMRPWHHREPGLAGVALTDPRLTVGVIADGVHLHPTTVAVAAAALGSRLSLVTDAVAALGTAVDPADAAGFRLDDGTLAGSTLPLDRAVRNVVAWAGVPVASAVAAATATPAGVLGLADRGTIMPGAVGDLVLLDRAGEVVATVIGGRVAFDRRGMLPHPRYR